MTVVPTAGSYLTRDEDGTPTAILAVGVRLVGANEGAWGNRIHVNASIIDAQPGTFHLYLAEVDDDEKPVTEEVFHNVVLAPTDTRALERLLALESKIARVSGTTPSGTIAASPALSRFHGGWDGADPRITEDVIGSESGKTGIHALLTADVFNLLCIPLAGWSSSDVAAGALWTAAAKLCEDARAFLIIDPPDEWSSFANVSSAAPSFQPRSKNAALYFPRVRMSDPLQEGRLDDFAPSGVVAGVMARTDAQRGIWKAPAGTDANLVGVPELLVQLTDEQQGVINQLGINCLRTFPVFGSVVWGARTLFGADAQASEWKHVPVRRLALYLEESLYRGSQWAVFEPNAEPLWAQMRANIGAFMHRLFRQGAFQGRSAREAYFIKCDAEITTPDDIDRGVVNVIIGFAPLRPAEFVIIKLKQLAGQAE